MPSRCGGGPKLGCLPPRRGLEIFGQHAFVAGEGERRKRIELEDADLQHLCAGRQALPIGKPPAIGDPDNARCVRLGDVVHAEQPGELDLRADLLEALPDGGIRRILVVVDETTGQAPEAVARLDRPSPQDDAATDLDDHGGCHLRVTPQDEAVVWAGFELAAVDHARHQSGAAVDAEVTHQLARVRVRRAATRAAAA